LRLQHVLYRCTAVSSHDEELLLLPMGRSAQEPKQAVSQHPRHAHRTAAALLLPLLLLLLLPILCCCCRSAALLLRSCMIAIALSCLSCSCNDMSHRSPVLTSISEAINGVSTIRAFGVSSWLVSRTRVLINKNASTSLLNQSLNRWLSVRLEGLGAFCTLIAALVTVEQQSASAAAMGLLLTYALQVGPCDPVCSSAWYD
jgi:ABC-type bacteriocin/lantibiotic exporter with double-glycine peptidase domain